jgi:hypothetical protein
MRMVEMGVDGDQRSRIVAVREVLTGPIAAGEGSFETVWSTTEFPPEVRVPRRGPDEAAEDNIGSTVLSSGFLVVKQPPNFRRAMHRTDTLDYAVVLAGSITLIADEGSIDLKPGDTVVTPGLRHGWAAGAEGCCMAVVVLPLADI